MKEIQLTQGKVALVDDEDFEHLNRFKWSYNAAGYAIRGSGPRKKQIWIYMHREIMHTPDGMDVDHINMNGCDNRRNNMRNCTRSQNKGNTRLRSDNTTGLKGVCWDKNREKWRAQITIGGRRTFLGRYNNPEEAACAYDVAAIENFGEFARINEGI